MPVLTVTATDDLKHPVIRRISIKSQKEFRNIISVKFTFENYAIL